MAGSKRKAEIIDLTGHDDQENHHVQPKAKKRADNREPLAGSSTNVNASSQQSSFDASAEVEDSQQSFNEDHYQRMTLYGVLSHKVVGVQYYRGHATKGEFVILRREPTNQYDENAIRVDNVNYQQIGHIPRGVAAKLAPFIDDCSLVAEGVLTTDINTFDAPISINLFGTSDRTAMEDLKHRMKAAKLPVNVIEREAKEREKRAKAAEKEKERQRKQMLKNAARGMSGKMHDIGEGDGEFANLRVDTGTGEGGDDMEDIVAHAISFDPRQAQDVVNQYAVGEAALSQLPLAKQPLAIQTKMLPYQLQGLAWMLEHENPSFPQRGSSDTVQLWKHNSNGTYTNIATNHTVDSPKLASGGILADDMGLGKTIQIISLIMADPHRSKQPTLILSPLSVMSNWSSQIATHVKQDHELKVLTYHGQQKANVKVKDLLNYDIVITTYQTVASEYFTERKHSALFGTQWRRVVVDEGHNLRNPKAKMTVAAANLDAKSKWILTGTPIVNNLKDLYSHVRFIGFQGGLEKFDVFNGALVRPLNQGKSEGRLLLQALMSMMCLRRMKDMKFIDLRLPSLSSHKYGVTFKPHEREKYEAFEQEAKGMLMEFERKDKDGNVTYSNLLEVLLRMRQTCNHWELTGHRLQELMDAIKDGKMVKLDDESINMLQKLLQLAIDNHEDCAVCLETIHNPVITTCAHTFGRECIERVIETQHKCPMCRNALQSSDDLVEPAQGGDGRLETDKDLEEIGTSSKVEALLNILKASNKKKDTKTVVFSQWTSFLDIIGKHLYDAGFNFVRLDGTMKADQRDAAMSALTEDPECTILLASLGVCSVGLNLTAANQVILADSWWAPAIEDQAIDRVYRLGQTRPVQVFRLVMEKSVEERVLDIQADKRKLMMAAFGETKDKRKERSARLDDIQRLLA